METMRKDLKDARDLHGQAESAAAVWKASGPRAVSGSSPSKSGGPYPPTPPCCKLASQEGVRRVHRCPFLQSHVMDRRKKTLTDYRRLRAFFTEEEQRFLQEAEQGEGVPEPAEPTQRFGSLLQAVLELERRHRSLGLSVLLQVGRMFQYI